MKSPVMQLVTVFILLNFLILKPEYFIMPNNCIEFSSDFYASVFDDRKQVISENNEMGLPELEAESNQFLNSIQSWQLSQRCL